LWATLSALPGRAGAGRRSPRRLNVAADVSSLLIFCVWRRDWAELTVAGVRWWKAGAVLFEYDG